MTANLYHTKTEQVRLHVSDDIGTVSAEYVIPENPIAVATLAHGAGADMHHSFMVDMAKHLAQVGIATLRFNFPFMENGKHRVDAPAVAHQTIAAAIKHAQNNFANKPLFAAGKSFGGRMTTQLLAAEVVGVMGVILYGFPLHPPKKPSIDRAAHLNNVKLPMLFLQGTKDALATWPLIQQVCASLPQATLREITGADHAFKAGKLNTLLELQQATSTWVECLIKSST